MPGSDPGILLPGYSFEERVFKCETTFGITIPPSMRTAPMIPLTPNVSPSKAEPSIAAVSGFRAAVMPAVSDERYSWATGWKVKPKQVVSFAEVLQIHSRSLPL